MTLGQVIIFLTVGTETRAQACVDNLVCGGGGQRDAQSLNNKHRTAALGHPLKPDCRTWFQATSEREVFILGALRLPTRGTLTRFRGQRYGLEAHQRRRGPVR